ncbi:MAG: hypothetical protein TREMPRED_004905, partial [Tremellales sp. Tagirdzhanova-0007]
MTPHEAIAIHDPIEEGRLVELEDVHIDHDDELNDIENPDEEGPAEEGGKKQKKKKKRRPTRKQASALAKAAGVRWTEGGCVPPEQPLRSQHETPEQAAKWEERFDRSAKTFAMPRL